MQTSSNNLELIGFLIACFGILHSRANDQPGNDYTSQVPAISKEHSIAFQDGHTRLSAPEDYPYQPDVSRVRDLIGVFESLSYQHGKEKNQPIISLSAAASRLFVMSNGLPLKKRCNKYVKLISKPPNTLTYSSVDLLMEEDNHICETEQVDAQLLPRLINERKFDSLGRLQTIVQSLESEKLNGLTDYDPSVKKDLLECMIYFIYRHQRATFGLTSIARTSLDNLGPEMDHRKGLELTLMKYQQIMSKIRQIEADDKKDEAYNSEWLNEILRLNDLARQNHYDLPKLVRDFITEPKRLDRLHSYDKLQIMAKSLVAKLVAIESQPQSNLTDENLEYINTLAELSKLVEMHKDLLPNEVANFLLEPKRWKLIKTKSRLAVDLAYDPNDKCALIDDDDDSTDSYNVDHLLKASSAQSYCRKLSEKLNCMLRTFNLHLMNSYQAMKLARSLNNYKIECIIRKSESSVLNGSQWLILSLTKKLSSWCSSRLREPSLSQIDKRSTMSVVELIHSIRGEG